MATRSDRASATKDDASAYRLQRLRPGLVLRDMYFTKTPTRAPMHHNPRTSRRSVSTPNAWADLPRLLRLHPKRA